MENKVADLQLQEINPSFEATQSYTFVMNPPVPMVHLNLRVQVIPEGVLISEVPQVKATPEVNEVTETESLTVLACDARGDFQIPKFEDETLETLEKKAPSFFAYLLGTQYVPESTIEAPRGRGRPRKYDPKPVGRRVHKIEEGQPIAMKIPVTLQRAIKKEFEEIYLPGVIPVKATVEKLARTYNIPYQQVFKLIEEDM